MNLDARIASLESRKRKLEAKIHRPDPMAASFSHGVGSMTPARAHKHHAAADRLARDAGELLEINRNLAFYRARKESVDAGECHVNGQPRADAPSRVKEKTLSELYGQFLRTRCKAGDEVELVCNGSVIPLIRLNARSVTLGRSAEECDTWDFFDIRPLNGDGSKMSAKEFTAAFKAWRAAQA